MQERSFLKQPGATSMPLVVASSSCHSHNTWLASCRKSKASHGSLQLWLGASGSEVRVDSEGLGYGSPPAGFRGTAPVGIWHRQFAAVKSFSTEVCCLVRPPSSPYPPKNTLDLCESHDSTRSEQGGHGWVPTRGYATANMRRM